MTYPRENSKGSTFVHRLRVRYPETDQQGIVYHSRYLEYFDVGMTEFFRELGWDYPDLLAEGCDPSVVKTELVFKQPVRFDEEINIAVRPLRVGNSSFALAFTVERSGETEALATGETIYVNIDSATGQSRSLPEAVRTALAARVET